MKIKLSELRQIVKSIIKEQTEPINYNGNTYTGQLKDGVPHGTGKLEYNSTQQINKYDTKRIANRGDYFEGEFKNGQVTFGKFFNKAANKLIHMDFGG
jgi:hypothetical protein